MKQQLWSWVVGRGRTPGSRLARMALALSILAAGLLATVAVDRGLARHGTAGTALAAAPVMNAAAQPAGSSQIQASPLISIPTIFRFSSPMPILSQGRHILAEGVGECSAGLTVSISFVITPPGFATGQVGEWSQPCTGETQEWATRVVAEPDVTFAPGIAPACGVATSRDGAGYIFDSSSWCEDILLVAFDHVVYLPLNLWVVDPGE
jgi:hypothetical protein